MQVYSLDNLKRLDTRFRVKRFANLYSQNTVNGAAVYCWDISSNGVGIVSNFPLDSKSQVKVTMNLPWYSKNIHSDAEVIWCRKVTQNYFRMGLKFISEENQ